MSGYRPRYTTDEEIQMLRFIIQSEGYWQLRGKSFWQRMEREIMTGRTWQSLKEHFRKVVVHDLAHPKFKLAAKEVKLIKYGYHSSAADSTPRKRDCPDLATTSSKRVRKSSSTTTVGVIHDSSSDDDDASSTAATTGAIDDDESSTASSTTAADHPPLPHPPVTEAEAEEEEDDDCSAGDSHNGTTAGEHTPGTSSEAAAAIRRLVEYDDTSSETSD
ncbi:hypothetical protein PPYR_10122 [Photinus pyralis]|uniref:TERF2-interacting telomeric protein 1 Myb domain-containing protein n=1 Tax=Photinus pyralis TaxID=7054 RepID=A0A5N4AFH1_PHOPY|nr:telomeric repeat-binding factor 2-interacting protein 1-like [Photinus pyralis]KAB0796061.1 hypothetical protein PPYR_10122 [Photinus pyralis]